MNISDHGELDYLTPAPNETDEAIARQIRASLDAERAARNAQDKAREMAANEREIAAELESL